MKKLLLSTLAIGCIAQAKEGPRFVPSAQNKGFLEQVTTPRKKEVDTVGSYDGFGYRVDVNWSQLRNMSMFLLSGYMNYSLDQKAHAKKVDSDRGDRYNEYQKYLTIKPYINLATIPTALVFAYQFLNGEKYLPVTATRLENSASESSPDA